MWTDQTRKAHYKALCDIDNRIVLAGEHCSYVNAWQEGAILSSLSAISRLHQRVVSG
jgi:monoamine oxidase